MKATINSSLLQKLKPKDKPYDVRDDRLTGLLVRVNISGKVLYVPLMGWENTLAFRRTLQ